MEEYTAPVWVHSCDTKLVDTVINEALHLITGCLVPTLVDMLPALVGIVPSHMRRNNAVLNFAEKFFQPNSLVPLPAQVNYALTQ